MNKKAIAAAVVLALLCAAGIITFVFMKQSTVSDPVAEIIVDGETVRTVSLSEETFFTVDTAHGYNDIRISGGCISVVSADCPDKVCVNTGATNSAAVPIICLPHRLEIRIVSAEDIQIDATIR